MKKLYPLLSVLFLIYWGCEEASEQLENEESKKSTLYNYTILDSAVQIKWSANNDVDFFSYKILRNGISIYETDNRVDTTHITSFENTYTFTIATKFLDSDTVHSNSILKHNLFYKVYVGHLGPISGNISVDDEYITSNGNDVNIFDSNGNHQWSDVIGVGAEYLNLYAEPYAISVTNNYYSASGINGWYVNPDLPGDQLSAPSTRISVVNQNQFDYSTIAYIGSLGEIVLPYSIIDYSGNLIVAGLSTIGSDGVDTDVWLYNVGLNGNGWSKSFGGSNNDEGRSVYNTQDGGFILTGFTETSDNRDVWLIKTNSDGDESWNRTFGGSSNDIGHQVIQTEDNGYAIIGETYSYGEGSDILLIKTDIQGNEEWMQTYDWSESDIGYSVYETNDGGYIITGRTNDGDNNGDIVLLKTDSEGNTENIKYFGGWGTDVGYFIQQTTDGGYGIIATYNNKVALIKTNHLGETAPRQEY